MQGVRPYQSANDYVISSVLVTNDFGDQVNIRNNVVELTLFESLDTPFLTGYLLVKDDFGLYDRFNINGTEIVEITLQQPTANAFSVKKTFILQNVMAQQKTNDQTEVLNLRLIEQIGFNNKLLKISKAYTGSPSTIIKNILSDNLQSEVNIGNIAPAQKSTMKFIIPTVTPLRACDMVRERASTKNGLPFFLYRTLMDDQFQFKSLEEMIIETPWNTGYPYRYSQAFTNSANNLSELETSFIVENFSVSNKEDVFQLVGNASVGALYQIIDATTGRRETFQFNAEETLNQLYNVDVFSPKDIPILSTQYTFQNFKISTLPSSNVSRVVMNSTHGSQYSNYYQEEEMSAFKLDSVNHALRNMMVKSSINITVPGVHYLKDENRSIGRQIEFFYQNNRVAELDNGFKIAEQELRDIKRSGKYVIYAARHIFSNNRHSVDLTGVKLGTQP